MIKTYGKICLDYFSQTKKKETFFMKKLFLLIFLCFSIFDRVYCDRKITIKIGELPKNRYLSKFSINFCSKIYSLKKKNYSLKKKEMSINQYIELQEFLGYLIQVYPGLKNCLIIDIAKKLEEKTKTGGASLATVLSSLKEVNKIFAEFGIDSNTISVKNLVHYLCKINRPKKVSMLFPEWEGRVKKIPMKILIFGEEPVWSTQRNITKMIEFNISKKDFYTSDYRLVFEKHDVKLYNGEVEVEDTGFFSDSDTEEEQDSEDIEISSSSDMKSEENDCEEIGEFEKSELFCDGNYNKSDCLEGFSPQQVVIHPDDGSSPYVVWIN
jgi:hypothetical protein